jgi:flagellar assembly factor FliW
MALLVETKRFGVLQVREDRIITFPEGLPGFPGQRRFVLVDLQEDSPLKFLQSVDDPDLAFLVAEPLTFFPDYRVLVQPEDLAPIALDAPERGMVVAIVSVPEDFREATVNLRAPVVINPERSLARQVILEREDYGIRTPLFSTA